MTKKGIDVSHWQGHIDWKKVAGDGISFTYIKATEGSAKGTAFVDPRMDTNYHGAKKNGLDVGFYHYARFISVHDAIEEAKWFINHIKKYKFTLPPVLDLEENSCKSVAEMNKGARAFLEYVEDKLGSAALYSYGNFYEKYIERDIVNDFAYWHARYNDEPVNVPLDKLFMWQHSSKGRVAGISGNSVDLDVAGGNYFTVNKKRKPSYIGKRVESVHNGPLRFYNKPSWDDKHVWGTISKGQGFPKVVAKVKVDGHYQYKCQNSKGDVYYITANSKYVKLI